MTSFQGRRFAEQEFPSPADSLPRFSSCSRCLIDLGNCFIVLTEGDGPSHHAMLFRLQVNRSTVKFEDDTQLSKEECATMLQVELAALTECDIVKVPFPYFENANLEAFKYRPCVALYGVDRPAIYLAIYNGTPKRPERALYDWELALSTLEDLSPDSAIPSIVDVSKMCGLPDTYNDPELPYHGSTTYAPWFLDPSKKRHPVAPKEPEALRAKIVAHLMQLLTKNPYVDSYFDSTIELDIGTWVTRKVLIDGEWAFRREVFAGPADGSSAGLGKLTVPTTPDDKKATFPRTPKVTR